MIHQKPHDHWETIFQAQPSLSNDSPKATTVEKMVHMLKPMKKQQPLRNS